MSDYLKGAKAEWARRAVDGPTDYTSGTKSGDAGEFARVGQIKTEALDQCLAGKDVSAWRVLEIGCGIGQLIDLFAPRFGGVVGADLSPEMIAQARERLARHRNVVLKEVDGSGTMPFEAGSFDFVYCISVFHHVPRSVFHAYVEDTRRVLKPGGQLFFQLTRPYTLRRKLKALFSIHPPDSDAWKSRYYTEGQMDRLARARGFVPVQTVRDEWNLFFMWKKA